LKLLLFLVFSQLVKEINAIRDEFWILETE
jgi:hypothetical protein